jgi:hypothetical protein
VRLGKLRRINLDRRGYHAAGAHRQGLVNIAAELRAGLALLSQPDASTRRKRAQRATRLPSVGADALALI